MHFGKRERRMRTKPKHRALFMPSSLISVANTWMRTSSSWQLSFSGLVLWANESVCVCVVFCVHSCGTWLHQSLIFCICVSFHIFAVSSNYKTSCHSVAASMLMITRVRVSVEMDSMRFSSQCSGFNEMILIMSGALWAIKRLALDCCWKYNWASVWCERVSEREKDRVMSTYHESAKKSHSTNGRCIIT